MDLKLKILMRYFPRFLNARSTLFGFVVVILLSSMIVLALLIQVDNWNRMAFNLVENNAHQVRLVMTMRDAVQKREMLIQRMIGSDDVFARDEDSVLFHQLAATYASAREALMDTSVDGVLLKNLQKLDESVTSVQGYHNDLVEALVFGDVTVKDFEKMSKQDRLVSGVVSALLDQIVESQFAAHENVLAQYRYSRQNTIVTIALIFIILFVVVAYAVRTTGKQFKRVSRLAIIDDVTGTYNRRYFDMVLDEEWSRSMREYTPITLLMLDIDFFKDYNDTFGHQMGDTCLYSIGKILSGQLQRASDFTARYGGEEFVIVLPNTKMEYARLLAERLRRSVEEARLKAGNESVSPWVTVSIGMATTTAEYEQSSSLLVKAADTCLYESKRNGRNRVTEKSLECLD